MVRGDRAVDRAADKLEAFVAGARSSGGLKEKVGEAFAGDPAFLRKLKPSLVAARARNRAPAEPPHEPPHAPSGPQLSRPKQAHKNGLSPWAVVGAALIAGCVLAKVVDWRGHAHPRD